HTNHTEGDKSHDLSNTVYAAATNINQLENIMPVVTQVAHKHRSLNIKPHHYPIVGKYLLLGMKDVLGDAATDEVINAWEKAYGVIADVFIDVERKMYEELVNTDGGWGDLSYYKAVDQVVEGDIITSFYLDAGDCKYFHYL